MSRPVLLTAEMSRPESPAETIETSGHCQESGSPGSGWAFPNCQRSPSRHLPAGGPRAAGPPVRCAIVYNYSLPGGRFFLNPGSGRRHDAAGWIWPWTKCAARPLG